MAAARHRGASPSVPRGKTGGAGNVFPFPGEKIDTGIVAAATVKQGQAERAKCGLPGEQEAAVTVTTGPTGTAGVQGGGGDGRGGGGGMADATGPTGNTGPSGNTGPTGTQSSSSSSLDFRAGPSPPPAPKLDIGDAKDGRVTELTDLLTRVLPWPKDGEAGFINLHWLIPAPRDPNTLIWIGKPTRTVEEFLSLVKWVPSRPTTRDVYFCLSLQSQTGKNSRKLTAVRNKGNALLLKAIWLDIDVKPPPKGYATLEEALDALAKFANAFGLPPPSALVGSGGGLHVYGLQTSH